MAKLPVFVTQKIPQAGLDLLLNAPELDLEIWSGNSLPTHDMLVAKAGQVAGLLTLLTDQVDAAVAQAGARHLRVISQMAVGYNNIDVAACTAAGIPVGHTPNVLTDATADLTVALMLATARQLIPAAASVKAGQWRTWNLFGFLGPEFSGSTVGLLGMGRIGLAVARRLQGFGVRLLYHNRQPSPQATAVGATYVSRAQLLAQSDFVSLHTPLTPETRHLIDATALAQMKPNAILINTARGEVIDQVALINALQTGQIAAAGLDVTTPEPLPADDPLLGLDNVVVLPHIGSASWPARNGMATLAAKNLLAGLRGQQLPHCVNPQVYHP